MQGLMLAIDGMPNHFVPEGKEGHIKIACISFDIIDFCFDWWFSSLRLDKPLHSNQKEENWTTKPQTLVSDFLVKWK